MTTARGASPVSHWFFSPREKVFNNILKKLSLIPIWIVSQFNFVNMSKDFHILALSGGGFRGLYTVTILDELEKHYKRPIAQAFDLICGTSIGGILALGLAAEIPASRLKELFIEKGQEIFRPQIPCSLLRWLFRIFRAPYSQTVLRGVLEEFFQNKTIGHLTHRVLIPAVNCTTGKGQFFKTPHHKSFTRDHEWPIVDVALATSAAPTYFPVFKNGYGRFVDGGLVGNAPGLFGYHEAKYFLSDNSEDLHIRALCIGTANQRFGLPGGFKLNAGFFQWRQLFDLIVAVQEGSNQYILQHLLNDDLVYLNDNPSPQQAKDVGLDEAGVQAQEILQNLAMTRVQESLGKHQLDVFFNHQPEPPIFYHGPNRNVGE